MRLNMGCGQNKWPGWINVDAAPEAEPDQLVNLEQTPWPWADNSASEVAFNHSLEHMGADAATFLAIMKELYRVCAPDAEIRIAVPHPRHDTFISDPTHVRPVNPEMFELFDRQKNEHWRRIGAANTPLSLYTGVDFELLETRMMLSEPYASQLKNGEMTEEQVRFATRHYNNVVAEIRMRLRARKP